MKRILEYTKTDLKPLNSFALKTTLNPDVWDNIGSKNETLKKDIKDELIEISTDYIDTVDFKFTIKDIVLVGSMCNYNWSEYSDFDLHILIDYKKVNTDIDLVGFYFDLHKKSWNSKYPIKIHGYDTELFVQNINDPDFFSVGMYSIQNDKWLKYPEKISVKIDIREIERKAKVIMSDIDDISNILENKKINQETIAKMTEQIGDIWKKIKRYRKEGLESNDSEMSVGNLIFKLLRRNDYLGKCVNIKKELFLKKYE